MRLGKEDMYRWILLHTYMYIYIYMYVNMYTYIYIHTYMHCVEARVHVGSRLAIGLNGGVMAVSGLEVRGSQQPNYLGSQVAGNNRPLYPKVNNGPLYRKVDHYGLQVAHNYVPQSRPLLV